MVIRSTSYHLEIVMQFPAMHKEILVLVDENRGIVGSTVVF